MERNLALFLFWILGFLGQVAFFADLWKPHVPLWVGIGVHLLPLCLVFVGDGVMEAGRPRAGGWLRVAGDGQMLATNALGALLRIAGHAPKGSAFYLTLMALSTVSAAVQLHKSLIGLGLIDPAPLRLPPWLARLQKGGQILGWDALTISFFSLCFVAAALFLLGRRVPQHERLMALSALAFFLLCGGIGVNLSIERWRAQRGGRRPGPLLSWLLLVGLVVGGAALLWLAATLPAPLKQRAYAAGIGVIYLVVALLPAQRVGLIRARVRYALHREGLVEHQPRGEVLIPYEAIIAMEVGEWANHVVLMVWLNDPAQLIVRPRQQDQGRFRARRLRSLEKTRSWHDADLVLLSTVCPAPPAELRAQLQACIDSPASRGDWPSWDRPA